MTPIATTEVPLRVRLRSYADGCSVGFLLAGVLEFVLMGGLDRHFTVAVVALLLSIAFRLTVMDLRR